MQLSRWSLILVGVCGFAALASLKATLLQPAAAPEKPFHAKLLEIAKHYQSDPFASPVDRHVAHWAPLLCRLPEAGKDYLPAKVRESASGDLDTHGQKLYYLFAKDQAAYLDLGGKPVAAGQFVVKESWHPVEWTPMAAPEKQGPLAPEFAVKKDRTWYRPGKPAGLYIMLKTDAKTPGTDDGWVYGTISALTGKVTAAGRVESCMECHLKAKHDRLFGLPKEDVQRIKTFIEKTKLVR